MTPSYTRLLNYSSAVSERGNTTEYTEKREAREGVMNERKVRNKSSQLGFSTSTCTHTDTHTEVLCVK